MEPIIRIDLHRAAYMHLQSTRVTFYAATAPLLSLLHKLTALWVREEKLKLPNMPTETRSTVASWFDTGREERLTQGVVAIFSTYCHLEREALHQHLHSIISSHCHGSSAQISSLQHSRQSRIIKF